MLISEIFLSIQGESTYAGLPCTFVRLAGCNLSCTWCDTPYSRDEGEGRDFTIEEALREVRRFDCGLVEITGGEPLKQADTPELAKALLDEGYDVLLETNGSVVLSGLDARLIKIVDVKCPSSGQAGSFRLENLRFITGDDEVKFVIADDRDYEFAKGFLEQYLKDSTLKVLFAPVTPQMNPKDLAERILRDCLKVRLQLQMHKYIWGNERGR